MMEDRLEGTQPNPQPEASPLAPGLPPVPAAAPPARRPFSPVVRDESGPDGGGEHGDAPRRKPSIVIVNRDDEEDRDDDGPEGDARTLRGLDEEPRRGRDPQGPGPAREQERSRSSTSDSSRRGSSPWRSSRTPTRMQVGDEVDVFLEKMENQDGLVVLSKQRADFVKVWDRVKEAAEKGEVVEGRLVAEDQGRRRRRPLRRRGLPAGEPDRAAPAAVDRVAHAPDPPVQDHQAEQAPPEHRVSPPARPRGGARIGEGGDPQARSRSVRCATGTSRTSPISAPSSTWAASTACSTSPTSPRAGSSTRRRSSRSATSSR